MKWEKDSIFLAISIIFGIESIVAIIVDEIWISLLAVLLQYVYLRLFQKALNRRKNETN